MKIKVSKQRGDSRLNFLQSTILPAIEREFKSAIIQGKLSNNISYEAESLKFLEDLKLLIDNYALLFTEEVEVEVDEVELNKRLLEVEASIKVVEPFAEVVLPDKAKQLMEEKKQIMDKLSKVAEVSTTTPVEKETM